MTLYERIRNNRAKNNPTGLTHHEAEEKLIQLASKTREAILDYLAEKHIFVDDCMFDDEIEKQLTNHNSYTITNRHILNDTIYYFAPFQNHDSKISELNTLNDSNTLSYKSIFNDHGLIHALTPDTKYIKHIVDPENHKMTIDLYNSKFTHTIDFSFSLGVYRIEFYEDGGTNEIKIYPDLEKLQDHVVEQGLCSELNDDQTALKIIYKEQY